MTALPGPTSEGTAPFKVKGETFETYYKLYGTLENRTRRPLIVLHGGPGMTHGYMLSCLDFATRFGIPTIFYDQIGNGRSTHLREKPQEFWTVDLFIKELENLVSRLGIEDDYDVLGHSWGGMLGAELEVRRHPSGLKHLILANSLAAMSDWDKSVGQLVSQFPEDIQDALKAGPSPNLTRYLDARRYMEVRHACIIQPTPTEVATALDAIYGPNGDPTVSNHMNAKEIKDWTIVDRLSNVRVPTLVLNGAKDLAQDSVVEPLRKHIPNSQYIRYEHSSHMPHWEERELYHDDLEKFLRS